MIDETLLELYRMAQGLDFILEEMLDTLPHIPVSSEILPVNPDLIEVPITKGHTGTDISNVTHIPNTNTDSIDPYLQTR